VLTELGRSNALSRRIHASYMPFLEHANPYSQLFSGRMIDMRAGTLGRI
jgi:hypothetical protein